MKYIYWEKFSKYITALTTTRKCGNLTYQIKSNDDVKMNRLSLCQELNIDLNHLIPVYQTHSDVIKEVTEKDVGKGQNDFESGIKADAIYTKEKGLALAIFHADCVPIFFYSPKNKIIGIIHAGQKGSLKEITKKSISYLLAKEQINPHDIYFYLGPSKTYGYNLISEEEKQFVIDLGYEKAIKETGKEQIFLDVPLLNVIALRRLEIPMKNIEISSYCTIQNNNLFYSALLDKEQKRMMSVILRK